MKCGNRGRGEIPMPSDELINSENHMSEFSKRVYKAFLTKSHYNNDVVVRESTVNEIQQELLRSRARWDRIFELKHMKSRIRQLPISTAIEKIFFPPKEYEEHIKVIDITYSMHLLRSVIVIIL